MVINRQFFTSKNTILNVNAYTPANIFYKSAMHASRLKLGIITLNKLHLYNIAF